MTDENPLLALDFERPIRFDAVRPEHVVPAAKARIREAEARLEAISAEGTPRSFDATLVGLDRATQDLELAIGVVEHLEGVATTDALREAFGAVQPDVSAFFSGIALSEPLWTALKDFAATDEAKRLEGPAKRFLEKTLADFRRSGADLSPADKERVREIDVELAGVTLKYGQNVLDATNAFELVVPRREELAGMPEAAIEAARESAAQKGLPGYRLTLQAPSYLAAMTYLDDGRLREKVYRAFGSRASGARPGEPDNRPLVRRILELRREKARVLGYGSFADLACEDRMAKCGKDAREFVGSLRERTAPAFEREREELLAFRRELEGKDAPPLMPWDVGYYAEKLRRARYDFDEEEVRAYFPFDKVLSGAFAVAERLYGLRVEPWKEAPVWHESVLAFQVREPDGRVSARFYVDPFPRESKRDGAWMHGLVSALPGRGAEKHVAAVVCNFTPPSGGKPALLRHAEVETLFHEFGHMLHHVSSRVPFRSLAGTNVARDFVELPSQVMENWCWEREALDLFAAHFETGARLPDALLERMRAAKRFRAATAMMRQLGFAELDLALHVDFDPASGEDVVEYGRRILDAHSPAPLPPEHAMACSFGHLFASPVGYAAGYYSYKWAEVLDADAFSRFLAEGLFSREVGKAFRDHVLSQGNAEDPAELYRRFMGRPPRLEALLERHGLLAGAA